MHAALRIGKLFTKKHPHFSLFYETPPFSTFLQKHSDFPLFLPKTPSPISFPAYGPDELHNEPEDAPPPKKIAPFHVRILVST